MPCDSITTISLDIKNADAAIMKKILEDKGYTIIQENEPPYTIYKTIVFRGQDYNRGSFNYETGVITMTGRTDMTWLKMEYTKEFVYRKVRKFGWKVKQVSDNKFQVIKR